MTVPFYGQVQQKTNSCFLFPQKQALTSGMVMVKVYFLGKIRKIFQNAVCSSFSQHVKKTKPCNADVNNISETTYSSGPSCSKHR